MERSTGGSPWKELLSALRNLMQLAKHTDKDDNSRMRPNSELTAMELKDIIKTLMLSELYFSLPLWERKAVVWRLWSQYGQGPVSYSAPWPKPPSPPLQNDDND